MNTYAMYLFQFFIFNTFMNCDCCEFCFCFVNMVKSNLKWFNIRQQHNKTWKKYGVWILSQGTVYIWTFVLPGKLLQHYEEKETPCCDDVDVRRFSRCVITSSSVFSSAPSHRSTQCFFHKIPLIVCYFDPCLNDVPLTFS